MNNPLIGNISQFLALIIVQVVIFNHVNFFGYLNPYIYILFIAFFPVKSDRILLIFISFILGLTIDMFLDSGGIHAAACVFIAYARPLLLKTSFGFMYEHQAIKFGAIDLGRKITYLALLILVHHLILFSLEIFSVSKIILILEKTLFSSIFTIILSVIISIIFSRKSK